MVSPSAWAAAEWYARHSWKSMEDLVLLSMKQRAGKNGELIY